MKFIRSDPKLKRHYRKNQFWFWKALETYALGIYFIICVNVFDQVPPPPHRTILQMFDDPIFIFMLAVVGTMALTYSIWDFHFFRTTICGVLSNSIGSPKSNMTTSRPLNAAIFM